MLKYKDETIGIGHVDLSCVDDLKMLGWTVPSECPIQNYTDANGVFHQRVGRVDLGSLTWGYGTYVTDTWNYTLSDYKPNGATYTISYNKTVWGSNIQVGQYMTTDNHIVINNGSSTTKPSGYLYYELATEVTKPVDGNENGKLKLLWENANTKTAFASQTITLNSSDYDYLELYYFIDTGNTALLTSKAIKGKVPYMMSVVNSSGTLMVGRRGSSYINDTSISIGEAQIGTTSNVANVNIIPYRIYGEKF